MNSAQSGNELNGQLKRPFMNSTDTFVLSLFLHFYLLHTSLHPALIMSSQAVF